MLDAIAHHSFTMRRSRRPRWGDLALALATGFSWWILLRHTGEAGAARIAVVAVTVAAVGSWRLSPPGALVLALAASVVLVVQGATTWPPIGPVVLAYLLAASDDQADRTVRRSSVLVAAVTAAYLLAMSVAPSPDLSVAMHALLAFGVAWFAGERTRLRYQQVAALHERFHQGAQTAEQEKRIAVVEERNRIARDLHDSAGHALNVIAVRAGAAQLAADGARALDALADIAELARRTAADVDHTVGRLRDSEEISRLPIGLASADTLIQEHRDAGLGITTTGDSMTPRLGVVADQAAYRFLQEALTNAARHGAGTATVTFSTALARLSITVTNPVLADDLPPKSTGHGLIGMRERATTLGGTVTISRPPRTFQVRLDLPTGAES